MLDKNPKTRISAFEALNHPYFLSASDSFDYIDEVQENIEIYNKFYQKEFHSLSNNCFIPLGDDINLTKNNESMIFFNKIPINGKIQTFEKMSNNSNFSIKLDSPLKIQRSLSLTKSKTKFGDMGQELINSCEFQMKNVGGNIYEAFNYINLLGDSCEEKVNKEFDEKKTNQKISDLDTSHNFCKIINLNNKNMK